MSHYAYTPNDDGSTTATPLPGHTPYPCSACVTEDELRIQFDQILARWFNIEVGLVGGSGTERSIKRSQLVDAIVEFVSAREHSRDYSATPAHTSGAATT